MENEKITLEQRFENIEEIIAQMESPEMTLDGSFELYKKGLEQVQQANKELDRIEKAMLVINSEGNTQNF